MARRIEVNKNVFTAKGKVDEFKLEDYLVSLHARWLSSYSSILFPSQIAYNSQLFGMPRKTTAILLDDIFKFNKTDIVPPYKVIPDQMSATGSLIWTGSGKFPLLMAKDGRLELWEEIALLAKEGISKTIYRSAEKHILV